MLAVLVRQLKVDVMLLDRLMNEIHTVLKSATSIEDAALQPALVTVASGTRSRGLSGPALLQEGGGISGFFKTILPGDAGAQHYPEADTCVAHPRNVRFGSMLA